MTKGLSNNIEYNYDKYKKELKNLKKIEKENKAVGQVFTKGLLPLYVLHILSLSPTNGNDIATQIGKKTNGLWIPSTGGIYPLLKKFEKENLVVGKWDDKNNKMQKIYTITEKGKEALEEKKYLLKQNIEEALKVFNIVYEDLYK
ncbi:PadR family transcriptional regulator [Clostridium cochlearium]|jgi:DNA-binding PadR family transcriptional regulator|uniref:PadR family transcriptional regulator n=1 Tax=Clostridium cochlearium TaxID=1494 RepID=A0A239ZNJ4_CLOCO|nr:PadR family transcriptional regulator [Clostridium cochlearium]MBE6064040.1 PadR family transcriptional regulator [Clostridium cochlearium]MBU5269692.1 PadR family transcriptional regulator [Clostridium cochlearium]MCG4578731.1 PadR family transcriptional regulator [Clostridium cochlearium]MDU1442961.1 PadR family transcriptional regulator [Clostridium cochlearium]NMA58834.1 PadR family transcriptional regulator [Clostridium cochlearium]